MRKLMLLLAVAITGVFLFGSVARAEVAGSVIGVTPDGFALRAGGEVPLSLKDQVESSDTLRTGATGRLEVLFADDSFIKMGSNTILEVLEFMPDPADPRFQTNLTEGVARFITGEIAASRPENFVINTPVATIGVRGTIIDVVSTGETTSLNVLSGAATINGVEISAGNIGIVTGSGPVQVAPATREQNEQASGLGPTSREQADSDSEDGSTLLSELPSGPENSDLEIISPNSDMLVAHGVPVAMVSGVLTPKQGQSGSGSFSFNLNLQTGDVNNAMMAGNFADQFNTPFAFSGTGGSGKLGDGTNRINGFQGLYNGVVLSSQAYMDVISAGTNIPQNGDIVSGQVGVFAENVGGPPNFTDFQGTVGGQ